MKRSAAIIALIVAATTATPSRAQDYPTRPIRALTTTSAGGISDIFMRALGDELHKRWGQHPRLRRRAARRQYRLHHQRRSAGL